MVTFIKRGFIATCYLLVVLDILLRAVNLFCIQWACPIEFIKAFIHSRLLTGHHQGLFIFSFFSSAYCLRWRQILIVLFRVGLHHWVQISLLSRFPAWDWLLLFMPTHISLVVVNYFDFLCQKLIVLAISRRLSLLNKTCHRRVLLRRQLLRIVNCWCTWFATGVYGNLSGFAFFFNASLVAIFDCVRILTHWKGVYVFVAGATHQIASCLIVITFFMAPIGRCTFALTLNNQIFLLPLTLWFDSSSLWLGVGENCQLVFYDFRILLFDIILLLFTWNC